MNTITNMQPHWLGFAFTIGVVPAMVTQEDECEVFIESSDYIGWIAKPVFWEHYGKYEDGAFYLSTGYLDAHRAGVAKWEDETYYFNRGNR